MFLPFVKYQGAGNDFVLVDDRSLLFPVNKTHLIEKLCHRRYGIGADGVVLVQKSVLAHFRMRIFNSDGKEASMCGNGLSCLIHYVRSLGWKEDTFFIETLHGIIPCEVQEDKVFLSLGPAEVLHWDYALDCGGKGLTACVVKMGVPHAVIFMDNIEDIPVEEWGTEIRHHPSFAPHGVNVNFAQRCSDGTIKMRTYERGVEGETMACGTGAAAVAAVAEKKWGCKSPIRLVASSSECLEVCISQAESGAKQMALTSPATFVFEGRIWLDMAPHGI